MLVHEPEGATIYSLSLKISINRFANVRASIVNPLLKAGCPQQVCSTRNSTSTPNLLRTVTTLIPASGKNWSTRQVMKRETFISFVFPTARADQKEAGRTVLAFARPLELPEHLQASGNWNQ